MAGVEIACVPGESFGEQVGGVLAEGEALCAVEVIAQGGAVVGVGAVLDDEGCTLAGREAAEIGEALLRNDDGDVVLGVVDVRGHGDDGGDRAPLCGGGGDEDRHVAVAGEVAGAADAVLDAGTHDVSGVDVAVDVGFDHAVHRDDAKAADDFGMVGDLLRTKQDAILVVADVGHDRGSFCWTEGESGGRRAYELAGFEEADEAVLDDLGVGGHVLEGAGFEAVEYGVGDVADTRLERQEGRGDAALLHLPLEEVEDVRGNAMGRFVCGLEGAGAVRRVGVDDGDDLLHGNVEVRSADALLRFDQWDGLAVGREAEGVVDVVHALEGEGLGRVDLEDDLVRALDPGLVVADGGAGDDAAVFEDGRDFDEGEVHLAEEAVLDILCDVAEVDVHVVHLTGIDALAGLGIGLVGEA